MPFATPHIRADKFQKHQAEFTWRLLAANEVEYERLADAFLLGPCPANTMECYRRRGHLLRYNTHTEEFGVLDTTGVILA